MIIAKHLITFFECIAVIAGFLNWNKWKTTYWKWVIIYLLVIFFLECTGNIFGYLQLYKANEVLYNYIGLPIEFLFYYWFYHTVCNKKTKPLAIISTIAFIVAWIVELVWITETNHYFISLTYCAGNLGIVLLTIAYIFNLYDSDDILYFKINPTFWFTIGVMLFYIGTFPYFGLFNYLYKKHHHVFGMYSWVMICLNYVLYLTFTFIFIWTKPKSSSLS